MLNLSSASTNPAPVESENPVGEISTTFKMRPADLSILRARGRLPSEQDVSQFQQALNRAPTESDEHFLDEHRTTASSLISLNMPHNVVAEPAGGDHEVDRLNIVQAPSSARLRWLERRQSLPFDKDETDLNPSMDLSVNSTTPSASGSFQAVPERLVKNAVPLNVGAGVQVQAVERRPVQAVPETTLSKSEAIIHEALEPAEIAANPNLGVNKVRARIPLSDSADQMADIRHLDNSSSPVSSVLPLIKPELNSNPKIETSVSTLDTTWASRTVQDTVRTTLRTLALRDLESLDAGRPVQITLDQGQLRGAQLTLKAQDGLLEVSVSTPHAQLRATLDAQQDALAQGLLRDVGAVRWVGLQDTLPSLSSSSDTNTSSASSQQNSQENASDRQNQREAPVPDPDEVGVIEKPSDRNQVIADAQSLRAFLGL